MNEDHDAILMLKGSVDNLSSDVGEMRGELRNNTNSLGEIKLTLARNGINGTATPIKQGSGGITLSKPTAWIIGIVALLAIGGAITLDVTKANEVVTVLGLLLPGG